MIQFLRTPARVMLTAGAMVVMTSAMPAVAQQSVEPEGVPVYRQKKTGFFQNPFSTTYQRLWNRSKSEATVSPDETEVVDVQTNAGFASTPQERAPRTSGIFSRRPSTTTTHRTMKPTTRQTHPAGVPNRVPAQARRSATPVNTDLPPEYAGRPQVADSVGQSVDATILKSLGPGEQVTSVKERIIGVYRNGQLVVLSPEEQARYQEHTQTSPSAAPIPARMRAVPPAPTRKKEIDPWFGDEVDVPSGEVGPHDGAAIESMPGEFEVTPDLPVLEVEPEFAKIEQMSYEGGEPMMIHVPLPEEEMERVEPAVIVAPARRVARPTHVQQYGKYQSPYRR